MKAIFWGVLSAFFFAVTFVSNRAMDLEGGTWIWSASLRYLFMVPFLLVIVYYRGNLKQLFSNMRKNFGKWTLWSFVGFVLFYGPLCFAASFGPGWLIASTWQITIIAGILLTPLFKKNVMTAEGVVLVREKLPVKGLLMSIIILIGVILMQVEYASSVSLVAAAGSIVPVLVACFAYPLGNRKMMEMNNGELDPFQRVLGMTLATVPFWLLLSGYEYVASGPPSPNQMVQSLLVAISSGIIATTLFFLATDMVNGDKRKLAAVEATQSIEVLFALGGEMLLLSLPAPSFPSWLGIALVITGVALHSFLSAKKSVKRAPTVPLSS